jgi:membrane-associated protease RseP (regulator of RpoE activity)
LPPNTPDPVVEHEEASRAAEVEPPTVEAWAAGYEPEVIDVPVAARRRDRRWLHAGLLALTFLTTTYVGAGHYEAFLLDFREGPIALPALTLLVYGLWYSGTILAILGAHEMGHYLACRYYGIDASLPYFIPAPFLLTGTLGAFIRIRQPIVTKRMLFDIGVAGPFAGFIVAVPALVIGLALSRVAALPPDFSGFELGEPLLFKSVSWLLWGTVGNGYSLNLHPMAFAAWFGLLATALNLFPIGQLDGGHVSYAVLGRRSTHVTLAMIVVAVGLTFFSLSWLVWTILMVVMLAVFGPQHPRTLDDELPLDRTRRVLAFVAFAIFVLCFTPAPIQPFDLIK